MGLSARGKNVKHEQTNCTENESDLIIRGKLKSGRERENEGNLQAKGRRPFSQDQHHWRWLLIQGYFAV